jgi:tetratricopeptide (TPR) repeat protein
MALFGWLAFWRSRGKRKGAERLSEKAFIPSGAGSAAPPKILITQITNDRGGAVGKRLADLVTKIPSVEVFRKKETLKLPEAVTDPAERLILAAEEGRAWLKEEDADLLAWGEVTGGGLTLRFLPAPGNDSDQTVFAGLGESIDLQATIPAELEPLIVATAIGTFGPSFRGARTRLGEALGKNLAVAGAIVATPPAGLTPGQASSMLSALGNAFVAYSRLGGGIQQLDLAAAAFQAAEKQVSKDSAPLAWARIQNHLAAVLQAQGQVKKDPKLLRGAAIIFSTVTATLNRTQHANDWAIANIYLGKVLYVLAGMEGKPKYLETAASAYEKALSVYDKETMPSRWAEVTNQYGVVLLALGEEMGGDAALEQAVAKFRTAMNLRQRDKTPLLWAQTANNLGAACFALAKRNAEASLLREASSCFEGATEIYRQQGIVKQAQVIEKNLQRVQRLLMTRGA